jgi:tetratricopeptide (TPR) repeat protein
MPMEPNNEHLGADEIGVILSPCGDPAVLQRRADHLERCKACREELAMHQREQSRLMELSGPRRIEAGAACASPAEWANVAAGLVSAEQREFLLEHAAGCDRCGALLRAVTEDFSSPLTEREEQGIEALRTSSPMWQRELARRSSRGVRKPLAASWLARAAAVLLCAGGAWTGYSTWAAAAPGRLLARSYTEQRPFELRIPGAEQAPLGAQQRGAGSAFQRPQPLMEAEVRIARELAKEPDSRKWLGLRARAEMLGRDPESAIATLNRALETRPDDAELLADLGMAYALRAESGNRTIDYARANENLSRALKLQPAMREATFNRALVYERLYLYDEAIREWQRYLTLDGKGAWADEARRRLTEIESKKNSGGRG